MSRYAYLRLTATDHGDPTFDELTTRLTSVVDEATAGGLSASVSVGVDDDPAESHDERDALLALADQWKAHAGDRNEHGPATMRGCADELVRLLATLAL